MDVVAKSNAERQAAYRTRRARDSRALQLWLDDADKLALKRLARHWGISQAEAVARLIREADKAIMDGMDDEQFEEYLALPIVTQ